MPVYTEEARELLGEYVAAVQEQFAALTELTAKLATGKHDAAATAPEIIEFHNNRVMDIYAKLQPFRLD